jgi:hypothetical protein
MENWFVKLMETAEDIATNHTFQGDEAMVVFAAKEPTEGEKDFCKAFVFGKELSVCTALAACAHDDPMVCKAIERVYLCLVKSG